MKDPNKRHLNIILYSLTIPIAIILSYFAITQDKFEILLLITPLFLFSVYIMFVNFNAILTGKINIKLPELIKETYSKNLNLKHNDMNNIIKEFNKSLDSKSNEFYYVYDFWMHFVNTCDKYTKENALPNYSNKGLIIILKSFIQCNEALNKTDKV